MIVSNLDEYGYYVIPPLGKRTRRRSDEEIKQQWAARRDARQLRKDLEVVTPTHSSPERPRL